MIAVTVRHARAFWFMTLAPGVALSHWDYEKGHLWFHTGRAALAALRSAVAIFGRSL